MIKEIEALMVHWGEQTRERGQGGGLGSQMGAIIEWGGAPPRGTPGSRVLGGAGCGIDHVASEVQAAVAELERSGRAPLARLARDRYCELVTVREQMKAVGISEGADRTYRNWIARLHQEVMQILTVRSLSWRVRPSPREAR
ncbi:hypothetical protein [Pseudomonas viridiflava]|uniref:hypothetical protein n=1 Tax=Pseudomonas viridiflava TaxID=33069 RepID=UPI000F0160E1|nr:hypothetical protein [Pseudomonas viridiflava]